MQMILILLCQWMAYFIFYLALLAPSAASFVQPVIYSKAKGISGRGVGMAGKGYMDKKF